MKGMKEGAPEETELEREVWARCTPADGIDGPGPAERDPTDDWVEKGGFWKPASVTYEEQIKQEQKQLKNAETKIERDEAVARLARLEGDLAVYKTD